MSESDSALGLSTLLVIDGDSLAHRAYHALPKSIRGAGGRPANALVGFAQLPRCGSGRPSGRTAVFVGWDTLDVPTYRHEALPGYQAGRVFDEALLEQLDALPALVDVVRLRRRRRRPATRPTTSSPRRPRAGTGRCVVATSDRDAFQLVSDRVTILQPVQGRERARADRAGRGARALRRRPGSGRRLHRAARRPLRPHPGRAGRRPEDGRRRCSRSTAASRRRSRPGASRRSPTSCGSTGASRRWTPRRRCPSSRPTPPDWAARRRARHAS